MTIVSGNNAHVMVYIKVFSVSYSAYSVTFNVLDTWNSSSEAFGGTVLSERITSKDYPKLSDILKAVSYCFDQRKALHL